MSKKLKYILFLVILTIGAACEKSHIDDYIPPAVVNLTKFGIENIQLYTFDSLYVDTIYATNAGKDIAGNTDISFAPDASYVDSLNLAAGATYALLPEQCYSLDVNNGTINSANRTLTFPVKLRPRLIDALDKKVSYVLPLKIVSKLPGQLGPNKRIVIQPVIGQAFINLSDTGVTEIVASTAGDSIKYALQVNISFVNSQDKSHFSISSGAPVLTMYNTARNTMLQALPEDAYKLSYDSVMPKGASAATLNFVINKSKMPKGVYSVALKLNSGSFGDGQIFPQYSSYKVIRIINNTDTARNARTGWAITDYDSYSGAGYEPVKIMDNDFNTYWQCAYNSSQVGRVTLPYTIVVDMGKLTNVNGFELWRRPGTYVTDLRGGYFEVSADNVNWKTATAFDCGTTNKSAGPFYFYCETTNARYIRIHLTSSNRSNIANIAEFFTVK
ncbi:BT_3987 domain-containing protein [Chitinophaga sp. Cy-1792]|uniref:BT_3987 domain-containing protein n=1 Tax=Chitinophaga sp. Cy-1792 TaxID=2608339 RepID=UPI001422AD1F|nr:DUF1735 domain-containing protein [Chitinophaga sp. Cy-1792]NIG53263.1 DUF1735 domain-containing protein [Chitinophaga sp. Cy-1792]